MKCTIEFKSEYNIGDTVLGEFRFALPTKVPMKEEATYQSYYNIIVIGKVKDIEFDENTRAFYYTLYGRILRGCPYRDIKIFKGVSESALTIIDPEVLGEIIICDPFNEED